jgi:hypothetical protein
MSRPRVRRRSDGISEIMGVPPRRRRRHPLVLALASAAISGAAVALTWLEPELFAAVWIPVMAAAAGLLVATLLLWRPRHGGAEPGHVRSSEPAPAPVRPIRPTTGASTRGA